MATSTVFYMPDGTKIEREMSQSNYLNGANNYNYYLTPVKATLTYPTTAPDGYDLSIQDGFSIMDGTIQTTNVTNFSTFPTAYIGSPATCNLTLPSLSYANYDIDTTVITQLNIPAFIIGNAQNPICCYNWLQYPSGMPTGFTIVNNVAASYIDFPVIVPGATPKYMLPTRTYYVSANLGLKSSTAAGQARMYLIAIREDGSTVNISTTERTFYLSTANREMHVTANWQFSPFPNTYEVTKLRIDIATGSANTITINAGSFALTAIEIP